MSRIPFLLYIIPFLFSVVISDSWEDKHSSYFINDGQILKLAKVHFIAKQKGWFKLEYMTEADVGEEQPYTELRNANNEPVIINDFGTGEVNVE